jgi:hypothetical protein
MSISVATAVVAPSQSVGAPAAPPAGAGDLVFRELLETFSSAAPSGDDSAPPAARAWTGVPLAGAMPAGVAGATDAAKGGPVRTGPDSPLEADGRTPPPGDSPDQTAALGTLIGLQVLPLPMPAAAPASLAGGSATAPGSGASITATADTGDRRTSAAGLVAADVARNRTGVDRSAAAVSTEGQAIAQAPGDARVATTSPSPTAGDGAGVRSGAGVLAAADAGGANVDGSGSPSPQVAVTSTDPQNATIAGRPMGPNGSGPRPTSANAQADRFVDSRAASMLPANAAVESRGPGSLGSGIDAQAEARPAGEQATRMPGAPTLADQGVPGRTDPGAQTVVSPRVQAPTPMSSPAATPAENQTGVAADRRSAAGVRLASALARGGRTEGLPGSGPGRGPNRVLAQATAKSVDADSQNVSTAGRVDVNAQADRLAERLRTEPLTFGAVVSAVEQTPVRVSAAGSTDLRSDVTLSAEPASDIKASGLAALVAAPIGVLGVGAPSSHAVAAAVAAAPAALDPAAESDLPRQIVQAVRLQWKDGIGDARIRLLPEYLGELSVAIRVEHGSVTAALEASTPAVRHWIESHEPMLRQSLAEQGLHLDRLIVLDEPEQAAPNQNREGRREKGEEPHERQRQSRRRPPADDTTFEVIV